MSGPELRVVRVHHALYQVRLRSDIGDWVELGCGGTPALARRDAYKAIARMLVALLCEEEVERAQKNS